MSDAHIHDLLFDYAEGTLGPEERAAVERHLQACPACREELAAVRALAASVAQLPRSIAPPADFWPAIRARLRTRPRPAVAGPSRALHYGQTSRAAGRPGRPRLRRIPLPVWPLRAALAVLLLAAGAGLWRLAQPSAPRAWEVVPLEGRPRVGSDYLTHTGMLREGEWLETGPESRAQIDVGGIGHVEVAPSTHVGIVEARPTHHRLALSQGTIEARIWAPPRLFFVETPSALAVDLGCVYTLSVDSTGASLLAVSSGWVALEHRDRQIVVPAGALCRTRPGVGPGTPFDQAASDALRRALDRFDFERDADALATILEEAGQPDVITLWHLLSQTDGAAREHVYDRLAALDPPPEGITREGILQGDEDMLQRWGRYLGLDYGDWNAF